MASSFFRALECYTRLVESTVRRVITGHGADGVAKVLVDGACSVRRLAPDLVRTSVWRTREAPAEIDLGADVDDIAEHALPFAAGSRMLIFEFEPHYRSKLHRSETIDYAIVLEGEVELQLDAETVTLRAGDVAVQRGTNHVWINRGTITARVAIVMVQAKPLGISTATTVA